MKNPNAVAALIAGAVSYGIQWLIATYANAKLSAGWQNTLDIAAITVVLWIGRVGISGAAVRLWRGVAVAASGQKPPA